MEPPNPLSLSPSLSLSFSLSLSLSLLIPVLARGLTALSVPACQKGPVIQHPPSGTGGKTHTYTYAHTHTHTHAHTHTHTHMHDNPRTLGEHAFTKALYTAHTHALCLSHTRTHTHTHTNIFPTPTKYLRIQKLLTALRGCSACCQHFSKYADILHALIRIKCNIHTDTNLLSFRLFHSSADTNSSLYGVLLSIRVIGWNLPIISYNLIMSGESEELTGVQSGVWNDPLEILNASLQMNLQVPPQLYSQVHHNTMCILRSRNCSLLSPLSFPDNLGHFFFFLLIWAEDIWNREENRRKKTPKY